MFTRRKLLGSAVLASTCLSTNIADVATADPAHRPSGPVADQLRRFVTDLADRGEFSGTVLLYHQHRAVFRAAHGLADRAAGVPNTLTTQFHSASVSKFLTAVTTAWLVQVGRLSFETTFGEAVPQLRNPALRPLTLHQLLTHTAALPQVNPEPRGPLTGSAMDHLPMIEELELVGTPGDRWRYSNAGYMSAAMMVEQVGRLRFDAAVRARVLAPARMRHTFAMPPGRPGARLAVRYLPSGETVPPAVTTGAGGWCSTVGDLVSFGRALLSRWLLDDHHTRVMITGKVPDGQGSLYGYGCAESTVNGHRIIEHSGGVDGASAWLQLYPRDGYVLAVMSNNGPENSNVQAIVEKTKQLVCTKGS